MYENIKNFVLACKKRHFDERPREYRGRRVQEDFHFLQLPTLADGVQERADCRSLERRSDSKPELRRAPLVNVAKLQLINSTHI